MHTISLRQFRDSIADQTEPVIVQRRDKAGNFQILGEWRPTGWPATRVFSGHPDREPYVPDFDRATPVSKPSQRK